MATDFIPRADAQFNEWQENLLSYLKPNANQWGIDNNAMQAVENLRREFENRYAAATDPGTRTHSTIVMKDEAREAYENSIRQLLKSSITYNTKVSDADRANMGLPIHKTSRTPVPAPSSFPEYTVETALRQIIVHFRDAGSESKARPEGVAGAVIRWAVLAEAPKSIDELTNTELDTATPFTLRFDELERGKRVYFCLAWQNAKGEKGPWGEIAMAIIP